MNNAQNQNDMTTCVSSTIEALSRKEWMEMPTLADKKTKNRLRAEIYLPIGTAVVARRYNHFVCCEQFEHAVVVGITSTGQVKLSNGRKFHSVRMVYNGQTGKYNVEATEVKGPRHADYNLSVIAYA